MHREKVSNGDKHKLFCCNVFDIDDAAVLDDLVQNGLIVVFEAMCRC